ncbi:PREDICTED: uncharacterized protein LOC106821171 [Priapulus caudatus]|uniref:Uncharacterized protein LOC106821171 n=1 Tax=Priapulus caudatus TaxID=37621 RepID=A0ABM1FA79_PRICU|nr:PREDICTED: uncharacterized protein LOC106821171 [Priapulus caudatus]
MALTGRRKKFIIQNAVDDDVNNRPLFGLSDFQRRKLSYYYTLIDMDSDGRITRNDIIKFTEKQLTFARTSDDSVLYDLTFDINLSFYESICAKVGSNAITCEDWLDVWAVLMKKCSSLRDFPYWVSQHCKLFFEIMDKDRDGKLTKSEFKDYYRGCYWHGPAYVDEQSGKGFNQMTASGKYPMDMDNFCMNFANFIIGKDSYGPGEYIFGVFDIGKPREPFKIVYPVEALDVEETDYSGESNNISRFTLKAVANTVMIGNMFKLRATDKGEDVERATSPPPKVIPQVPRPPCVPQICSEM